MCVRPWRFLQSNELSARASPLGFGLPDVLQEVGGGSPVAGRSVRSLGYARSSAPRSGRSPGSDLDDICGVRVRMGTLDIDGFADSGAPIFVQIRARSAEFRADFRTALALDLGPLPGVCHVTIRSRPRPVLPYFAPMSPVVLPYFSPMSPIVPNSCLASCAGGHWRAWLRARSRPAPRTPAHPQRPEK